MNRRHFIGLAAVAPLAGCSVFKDGLTDAQKISLAARLAKVAAYSGTSAYLAYHHDPGDLAAFRVAAAALKLMVDDDVANVDALQAALSQLPVGSLDSTSSRLVWAAGVQVWDLAIILFDVRTNLAAEAIATAVWQGMTEALNVYPASKAMPVAACPPAKPTRGPKTIKAIRI